MPSADVDEDEAYYTGVLGGELIFRVRAMGTTVSRVRLGAGPDVLLAGHLHGERPVLVYRVDDLEAALAGLRDRGWSPVGTFEIPHGPCCAFESPNGHRFALYQLVRPGADEHFAGRIDE
ncbi:MAG: VOC family protein [Actinobacteria bacterium]|nr:VOC family protein [Actinomycetota bacterium]